MRNDYDKFYVKIQYALNPMVIMSWVGIDEHTFRVSCKKVLIFYFFLHNPLCVVFGIEVSSPTSHLMRHMLLENLGSVL